MIARSSPRRLRIALQPTLSSFNGRALVEAVQAVDDVAFTGVDEARTLHGKLIEWTSPEGSTTAVVGSPNLTTAALCGTVGDGHNCELAIRSPVARACFPTVGRSPAPTSPARRGTDPTSTSVPAPPSVCWVAGATTPDSSSSSCAGTPST